MRPFDYLSVILAIVLGLGIAHLLTAAARLIRNPSQVSVWYAPSLMWAAMLFIVILQHWWSEYGRRMVLHWSFLAYLATVLIPTVLYLLAYLVLPSFEQGRPVDLRADFHRIRPWFFSLILLLLVLTEVQEYAITGSVSLGLDFGAKCIFFAFALAGILWGAARAQLAIALGCATLLLLYIAALFRQLPA